MAIIRINEHFLTFLKHLNIMITENGELGSYEYHMQGTGMKGDLLVLKNYTTREIYHITADRVTSDHMDMGSISSAYENAVLRLPNSTEEQYFQASTLCEVLSMECEQELQLAMHNLATYTRDLLGLYNDELWHKPYSDM